MATEWVSVWERLHFAGSLPFQEDSSGEYGLSVGFSRLRKKYDAEKVK